MNYIKKICLRILLSKEVRRAIWESLVYQKNDSIERGDFDETVRIKIVMEKLNPILGIQKMKFTRKEVKAVIEKIHDENLNVSCILVNKVIKDEKKVKETDSFKHRDKDDGVNYEEEKICEEKSNEGE